MINNEIICGDAITEIINLPKATMVFADPPDNIGLGYDGYDDKRPPFEYVQWLISALCAAKHHADIVWFSVNHRWMDEIGGQLLHWQRKGLCADEAWKWFIWYFTFGQHRHTDCGNNYRPILRWIKESSKIYPDAIRVQSERQKTGDKRADPRGRVPGDVWCFPRVVGNAKERRPWHNTQHPEAIMERILKFSCKPGDTVIDMFAGTFTTARVCKRLGINCYSIEQSEHYCEIGKKELSI